MTWFEKILLKNRKEIIVSAISTITIALVFSFWVFCLGERFQWRDIEPLSAPPFWCRAFYSALTFVTFGAFLYAIQFYRLLYLIFVECFNAWPLYRGVKGIIWLFLMILSWFTLDWFADLLNNVISFLYNIFWLAAYLNKPLSVSVVLIIGVVWFLNVKFGKNWFYRLD